MMIVCKSCCFALIKSVLVTTIEIAGLEFDFFYKVILTINHHRILLLRRLKIDIFIYFIHKHYVYHKFILFIQGDGRDGLVLDFLANYSLK